ncbi:two-component system, OmpR family, sensor histidine kinase MtrB, partial [Streptomyces sp. OspMP-M43]
APSSVHPAALPGNGARVVARPAPERPAGRPGNGVLDSDQEDSTRGY